MDPDIRKSRAGAFAPPRRGISLLGGDVANSVLGRSARKARCSRRRSRISKSRSYATLSARCARRIRAIEIEPPRAENGRDLRETPRRAFTMIAQKSANPATPDLWTGFKSLR